MSSRHAHCVFASVEQYLRTVPASARATVGGNRPRYIVQTCRERVVGGSKRIDLVSMSAKWLDDSCCQEVITVPTSAPGCRCLLRRNWVADTRKVNDENTYRDGHIGAGVVETRGAERSGRACMWRHVALGQEGLI